MQEVTKTSLHRKKRPINLLMLSLLSFVGLGLLIFFFQPTAHFSLFILQLPVLPFFFVLLFFSCYGLCSYLFKSRRHGILITCFVIIYLLFRLNNLTHPFFLIILAALFLTVELLFSYRKE